MSAFYRELVRRDGRMAYTACGLVVLAVACLTIAPFDERTVTGANPWLKPVKFQLSFAVYAATIGWLVHYVRMGAWLRRWLSRALTVVMVCEIAIITSQAARGTASHFNFGSMYDMVLFFAMGFGVVLMTFYMMGLLAAFFVQRIELPAAYLWGIRMGLALFLLGLVPGWYMILYATHTVGGVDGGPGLVWVGWSTVAGDLRVAHFLGLHALQAMPLAGYAISRWSVLPVTTRGRAMGVAAAGYAAAMLATFAQAMAGMPVAG